MDPLAIYDYQLPKDLIAHEPATPREQARLFVYDTMIDKVELCRVCDLPKLLANTLCIYNDTKVEPARLQARGVQGNPVELLVLVDQGFSEGREVRALVNRFTPISEVLTIDDHTFTVLENAEKSMVMRFNGTYHDLQRLLEKHGQMPLPPYIHSVADESTRRTQYQTIFAKEAPSVAAPTASLHFTELLLQQMQLVGTTFAPVTLQVGLGTFAPVFPEHFAKKALHQEFCSVPQTTATAIKAAKTANKPVVAIGTTVVRTLESHKVAVMSGNGGADFTDLFIFPPYQFAVVDALMTNFHVPRSSLLCLVDAFLQHKGARRRVMDLYQIAIAERFRFYSFGDAMLIL